MLQPNPETNNSERRPFEGELPQRPPLSPILREQQRTLAVLALRQKGVESEEVKWLLRNGSSQEAMKLLDELIEDGDQVALLARSAVRRQLELRF